MTDNNHPITPSTNLIAKWIKAAPGPFQEEYIAIQAARWGSDQELEACCEWLNDHMFRLPAKVIRAARRPNPPSLKEQALQALDDASDRLDAAHENIIRRALEQLND